MCKKKMATSAESLCRYSPPAFKQFIEIVTNLKFDEEPKYAQLAALFSDLIGAAFRPTKTPSHLRRVEMRGCLVSWKFSALDCIESYVAAMDSRGSLMHRVPGDTHRRGEGSGACEGGAEAWTRSVGG